jgi:cellobionic acid phosphorylase
VYLSETNDHELLNVNIPFADDKQLASIKHHIDLAMETLIDARDHRGLSYIEQGDWCDPMNMVGYKGKGVSAWLSLATAYALNSWADICEQYFKGSRQSDISRLRAISEDINKAVNNHLWDDNWYGRGITDDDVVFGVEKDAEGRIYLNPQSWSILSGAASNDKIEKMTEQVKQQLMTPYGVMMLAPSYTHMREDVGRLTQKHPGVSENGAVYNHAAVFYAYSLYSIEQADEAFDVLYKMLSLNESAYKKGQLPNFIPNYYRGAFHQFPEQAGKSSQLFNTGTVAWYQRCVIEGLCGLKGQQGNLVINPQLPKQWTSLNVKRSFQGARFNVTISKTNVKKVVVFHEGDIVVSNTITNIKRGGTYNINVEVPK